MTTEFLALNNRNSGTAGQGMQAFRILGATPNAVGSAFGNDEVFNTPFVFGTQRLVQFKGARELYCGGGGEGSVPNRPGVWKFNHGAGTWSIVFDAESTWNIDTVRNAQWAGPYVVLVNGQPHLAMLGPTNNNGQFAGVRSPDGTSWSHVAGSAFPENPERDATIWNSHVYGNAIYCFFRDHPFGGSNQGWFAVSYDPTSQTISRHAGDIALHNNGGHERAGVCILNGRRWLINSWPGGGADAPPVVVEWPAGQNISASLNRLVLEAGGTDPVGNNRWALFTDGTFLYALYYYQSSGDVAPGWHLQKLQESGSGLAVVSDLTDVVLPGAVGRNSGLSGHFTWMFDQEANPFGVPEIRLYHRGGSWSSYTWNGDAALIGAGGSPNDSGASASILIPGGPNTDDQPIWWSDGPDGGSINIELEPGGGGVAIEPAVGGETIYFKIYGPLGTETVNVKVAFGVGEEFQDQQANILSSSHGAIVSNEVQGLTADGTTLYSLVASYPGVGQGDPVQPQLFVQIQP